MTTITKEKDTAGAGTGTLNLKGEKNGTTKGLDDKTILRSKPDPLVVERAKEHVENLEKIIRLKEKANATGEALRSALKKSKKARIVKINGELGSYVIEATELYKLMIKKDKTVN